MVIYGKLARDNDRLGDGKARKRTHSGGALEHLEVPEQLDFQSKTSATNGSSGSHTRIAENLQQMAESKETFSPKSKRTCSMEAAGPS